LLSLSPGAVLQAENRAYGHARALSEYAGFSRTRWVPGALQHGWNPYDGIGMFDGLWRPLPKFVWSGGNAQRGRERGGRNYVVIGAPWLYLLRHRAATRTSGGAGSTIAVPFHATVHLRLVGEHSSYARDLRSELDGARDLTVCLQWMDYEDAATRAVYEDIGARVITLGRGTSSAEGHDSFLHRQLDEFDRHDRVVSNRLSTAVFYGAAAGKQVGVYGTSMTLQNQPPYEESDIPQRWPELHEHTVEPAIAHAVALHELGGEHVLEPAELRDLMGWTGRGAATQLAFLGRRATDLVRLNMHRSGGVRHLRAY
jgi:hypothetical protein